MAPNTYTLGPPEPILPCLDPSCIHHFYNRTGRSNHMHSQHPQFVPDLQQANAPISSNSIPSSQMSSPPSPISLDSRSQSRGSDHNDHNNHGGYNDHNSADELPVDDLDLDIPFDGGEYQRLNGGSQSPERSNTGSSDQAHDPTILRINRVYHPIINGGFLVLLTIFHVYSQIHFQGQSATNMGMTFHQTPIHLHANLTVDHMIGLHIITGLNLKWLTFSTVVTRCLLGTLTLFLSCGPPLWRLIMMSRLSQIMLKCTTQSTQPLLVIFLGNCSPWNTMAIYLKAMFHRG